MQIILEISPTAVVVLCGVHLNEASTQSARVMPCAHCDVQSPCLLSQTVFSLFPFSITLSVFVFNMSFVRDYDFIFHDG